MIKAAVVGATGYTGVELVDILLRNPKVELTSLSALIEEKTPFAEIFPRFAGRTDLECKELDVSGMVSSSDVVFLALPHTVSMKIAPVLLKAGKRVVDLSADYRIPKEAFEKWYSAEHLDPEGIEKAVYGLPELNRDRISQAQLVANPGCYPTSAILALKPIAGILASGEHTVAIDAKTGATGAGRKGALSLSFSEIDEDLKCYKPNEHQHMPEMEHVLSTCAGGKIEVNFVPHLLPVKRGILSTVYVTGLERSSEDLLELYRKEYENEPFVRVKSAMPRLSDVVGTNFCDISLVARGDMTVIVAVIDNLMKGASGQAVQNMNIMFSLEETLGLI